MKYRSVYLDWYVNVPKLRFDFRSSGLSDFKYNVVLGEFDLSANYAHGNPETVRFLARYYGVSPENVFVSSDGASGQNARVVRIAAENNPGKDEAVVEYPTYEPLLRLVQEHFPRVKRLERAESCDYALDSDALRGVVSDRTGLLVLTNPHAPSGAVASTGELREVAGIASEYGFPVLCDEIYAEFEREHVPTFFSVAPEVGIVTSSFSKAYGLGGLKLGVVLTSEGFARKLRSDYLSTVGAGSNLVEAFAAKLWTEGGESLENHKQRWLQLKAEASRLLDEAGFDYFHKRSVGVTFWLKLPVKDSYRWVNETAIPRHRLALVPGAFFLFKEGYSLVESNAARLGLGGINPDKQGLAKAFTALREALKD